MPFLKSLALLLPVTALLALGVPFLTGCADAGQTRSEEPPVATSRYDFVTQADPKRGEVVKIYDRQSGDYWIKWVGVDLQAQKTFLFWSHFPLDKPPVTGITEIAVKKPEMNPVAAASTGAVPETAGAKAPATP